MQTPSTTSSLSTVSSPPDADAAAAASFGDRFSDLPARLRGRLSAASAAAMCRAAAEAAAEIRRLGLPEPGEAEQRRMAAAAAAVERLAAEAAAAERAGVAAAAEHGRRLQQLRRILAGYEAAARQSLERRSRARRIFCELRTAVEAEVQGRRAMRAARDEFNRVAAAPWENEAAAAAAAEAQAESQAESL